MTVKEFNTLPEEAVKIRTEVFITEQNFVDEFDDVDNFATHMIMYDGDKPIAVCRYFYDEKKKSYMIGRIAVIKEYRNKHIGSKIMAEAERCIKNKGASFAMLSAQTRAKEFYKKQGYTEVGEIYYEEYCPHICMKKELL